MNQTRADGQRFWIISPFFDFCCFINLWWVAAFLPLAAVHATLDTPVDFWQVYFLTTPHRWITLLLVAADPDRRQGRSHWFILIAVVAAACVLGFRSAAGTFNCLILIDFVWNAWHFASQHLGILRIYGRMGGGGRPRFEGWTLRTFVTYTALRTAGWWSGLTSYSNIFKSVLEFADFAILVLPAALILVELSQHPRQRPGKVSYLISVVAMYTTLLIAIRNGLHSLVIPMTVATAAFHAVEYLAIVTYYAWRRRDMGSEALFRTMAQNWIRVLGIYIVVIGIVANVTDRHWKELYVGLNLWAAFLHYAYDGMIWKLRRPETAKTLGVELQTGQVAESG